MTWGRWNDLATMNILWRSPCLFLPISEPPQHQVPPNIWGAVTSKCWALTKTGKIKQALLPYQETNPPPVKLLCLLSQVFLQCRGHQGENLCLCRFPSGNTHRRVTHVGSVLLTKELGFWEEPLENGKYKSIMADQVFIIKARSCGFHWYKLPKSL